MADDSNTEETSTPILEQELAELERDNPDRTYTIENGKIFAY